MSPHGGLIAAVFKLTHRNAHEHSLDLPGEIRDPIRLALIRAAAFIHILRDADEGAAIGEIHPHAVQRKALKGGISLGLGLKENLNDIIGVGAQFSELRRYLISPDGRVGEAEAACIGRNAGEKAGGYIRGYLVAAGGEQQIDHLRRWS